MTALFLSAFVTLFVVIDPPGCAPIYASLTTGASAAQRRAMAIRAVGIAAAILLVFALWGKQLLGVLGIELDSFRIAGGIMLALGSGPVKGFAIVLLIGIATSVFTAVTFTRLLASRWVRAKRPTEITI